MYGKLNYQIIYWTKRLKLWNQANVRNEEGNRNRYIVLAGSSQATDFFNIMYGTYIT